MPIQRYLLYYTNDFQNEYPAISRTQADGDWVHFEDVAALEAEIARLKEGHCKDCCCARSWEALGNPNDGRSIPEHIVDLKAKLAALEGQTCETCADFKDDTCWSMAQACLLVTRGCRAWKERTDG